MMSLLHVGSLHTYQSMKEKQQGQGISRGGRAACCISMKIRFYSPKYSWHPGKLYYVILCGVATLYTCRIMYYIIPRHHSPREARK